MALVAGWCVACSKSTLIAHCMCDMLLHHQFHATGGGQAFSDGFGPGDTIGCGVDYSELIDGSRGARLFYTRNGTFIGYAFDNLPVESGLHPCVGIDSMDTVTFNFGASPFVFDLKAFSHRLWYRVHFHINAAMKCDRTTPGGGALSIAQPKAVSSLGARRAMSPPAGGAANVAAYDSTDPDGGADSEGKHDHDQSEDGSSLTGGGGTGHESDTAIAAFHDRHAAMLCTQQRRIVRQQSKESTKASTAAVSSVDVPRSTPSDSADDGESAGHSTTPWRPHRLSWVTKPAQKQLPIQLAILQLLWGNTQVRHCDSDVVMHAISVGSGREGSPHMCAAQPSCYDQSLHV